MKSLFGYQMVCRRDDNGSFVAYVPAIPGCHAIGHSPAEARHELENVFSLISEEYAESGRKTSEAVSKMLPPPDRVLS
jgi:predicted RNase H-like HicB family nuclease